MDDEKEVQQEIAEIKTMFWHSSMGDGWHPFIIGRSIQFCKKMITVLNELPHSDDLLDMLVLYNKVLDRLQKE